MNYIKTIIITVTFGITIFNPVLVFAQPADTATSTTTLPSYSGVEDSIGEYLCTPTGDGKDLERCVNRLYRFGITAGALVLVAMVVFAGYLYITAGETGKGRAKGILKNSLVGMALLLGSYALLYFINPSLVAFRAIQPPIFVAKDLPSCAELGLGSDCIVAGTGASGGSGNGSIVSIAMAEVGNKGAFLNTEDDTFALRLRSYLIHIVQANNTGPLIDKYFSPGGTPGEPWCAFFASWVYGQAGIKTIGTLPGRGGSLTLNSYFKNNKGKKVAEGTIDYHTVDEIVNGTANILPGDLAFFDRGTSGDANGHTAVALGYEPSTKKLASVDGNLGQSDEVKRSNRSILTECVGGSNICKLIGVGRVVR